MDIFEQKQDKQQKLTVDFSLKGKPLTESIPPTPRVKHITWVDIIKSLLIVFVVMGHAASPYNRYFYLFHMPAFFFISGYLEKFDHSSFNTYLKKKFRTLLVPFLSLNILFYLLRYLLGLISLESIFYTDQMKFCQLTINIKNLFAYGYTLDLGGASWFLLSLFLAAITGKAISMLGYRFNREDGVRICLSLVLYWFALFLHTRRITLPWVNNLDLGLHALFYFIMGFYFKKHQIFQKHINHMYAIPLTIFILYFFSHIRWGGMDWPTRTFTFPINTFTAISGLYLCYLTAKWMDHFAPCRKLGTYVGTRTLSILMFHFMGFRIYYYLMNLLGQLPEAQVRELVLPTPNSHWPWATLFGIGFSLTLDWGIRKSRLLSLTLLGLKKD